MTWIIAFLFIGFIFYSILGLFGILDLGSYKPQRTKNPMKKVFEQYETDPLREIATTKVAQLDPEFAKAQTQDITKAFLDYIEYQATHEANILVGIQAPQGKGKSLVGLWCVTKWQEVQKRIFNTDIDIEFAFNSAQTRTKLKKIRDKGIVQKDEDSEMKGSGKTSAKNEEHNYAETMRYSGKSLVICAPHLALLSGMTILLLPQAILSTDDPTQHETRVVVYFLKETRPGKSADFLPIGYLIAKVAEIDPKLMARYRKEKDTNFRKLDRMGGGVGAMGKEEVKELRKLAKKVFKKASKDGWPEKPDQPSKKALNEYIFECEIPLTGEQKDIVKNNVVKLYKKSLLDERKEYKKQKKTDEGDAAKAATKGVGNGNPQIPLNKNPIPYRPFIVDYNQIFAKMRANVGPSPKERNDLERDIEIYLGSKDMLKTSAMYAQKYNITEVWVGQIRKTMVGRVAEMVGHVYEDFLEPYFKAVYPKVTHCGKKGEPDFICESPNGELIIYSIKCYDIKRKTYDLSYDEANAEITYARKIWDPKNKSKAERLTKQPRVISHLLNLGDLKIYEYELEPVVIDKIIPFGNRKDTIEVGKFTRDPSTEGYIIAVE